MSMTQIAFLRKADLPTNKQIQDTIQKLGYDFQVLSELEKQIDQDGLDCSINGHPTYFETYVDVANNAISENEADWINPDITNQDTAISFVWDADFAAGACIGLISIALTELSDALVYYMDDQMKYTREMLFADTPQFLDQLKKQNNKNIQQQGSATPGKTNIKAKETFWDNLKNKFK